MSEIPEVVVAVAAVLGFAMVGAILLLALIGLAALGIERLQDWRDELSRSPRIRSSKDVPTDWCVLDGMSYHQRGAYVPTGTTPEAYWRDHYAEWHPNVPFPGYPACVTPDRTIRSEEQSNG